LNALKKASTTMNAESAAASTAQPKAYRVILWSGLIAGVLDILSAFVHGGYLGRTPMAVLQSISSGLLGAEAYNGGIPTAALGLALHFLIAFVATTVFYAATRKLTFLLDQAVISGIIYGVVVYFFMYGVVLPLTFHRSFLRTPGTIAIGLGIHILFVGLPIALAVRHFSKPVLVAS